MSTRERARPFTAPSGDAVMHESCSRTFPRCSRTRGFSSMVSVAAVLALLLLAWPPSSWAGGGIGFRCAVQSGRTKFSARLARARQAEFGRHSQDSAHTFRPCSQLAGQIDARRTLSSLRGGGGDEETPLLTLLVRVFWPSYGRKRDADKSGLDLEEVGLVRRIRRFVFGLLRKRPTSGVSADKTKKAVGQKKGNKKNKASTKSHLETSYRPGNANYRIQKELKEFMANPPDNCKVSVGKNIRVWIITITGAEGTIYAEEEFRLRVAFPEDYPTKPPAVYFLQSPPPPKHQHIYTNGDICLSLLSTRDWKPNLTVMSLALSILSMLSSAKEKRVPEDNASHANARPGQAQQWIYHDDSC